MNAGAIQFPGGNTLGDYMVTGIYGHAGPIFSFALLVGAVSACGSTAIRSDGGTGGGGPGGNIAPDGGAGGSDGGGSGGLGGAGGRPEGCVDIVVSPGLMEDPRWSINPLSGGVWRTSSGLHVAWKAYVATPGDGGMLVSRPWLFVSTFDAVSGGLRRLRRYDLFPFDVTSDSGDVHSVGGADSEIFAASMRSWDTNMQPRNQTLFLGRLDDDASRSEVDLGWSAGANTVRHIGWDGEAFAVHASGTSTPAEIVARVSPAGQLILPSARYGSAGLDYRISTNAQSGMTYLLNLSLDSLLSGHDRSGQPLPWAATSAFKVIIPGINEGGGSAFNPGLAADSSGGAWLMWSQDYNTGMIGVAAHVTQDSQVDRWFRTNSPDMSTGVNRTPAPAVIARGPSRALIAEKIGQRVYIHEYDDPVVSPPRLILDNHYFDNTAATTLAIGFMNAFDWQDETWLSFSEQRTNVATVLHVVKVHGGCKYSPATKPAQ